MRVRPAIKASPTERPWSRPDSWSEAVATFPVPTARVRARHAPVAARPCFAASARVSAPRYHFLSALAVVLTSLPSPHAPVTGHLTSLHFPCRSPPAAPPPPSTFLIVVPLLGAGEPRSDRSHVDHRGDAVLDLPPPDTGAAQPEPPPAPLATPPRLRACRLQPGQSRGLPQLWATRLWAMTLPHGRLLPEQL
jgi:hypothetical protein